MTQRTDGELAAAYLAGDQGAAEELVRRHGNPLGRFLYGAGAAVDDIEDLVQEAFFRAFTSLGSWRGQASFRSWLYRIGSNLHRDLFRRQKIRRTVPLDDHDVADRADPASELGANEAEARILEELAQLPRLQREVFLLRAQQGLDYDEIAAALGTTPGSSRVHYHHAVKRLKERVR
jgi:RNA polymerase sigma-70 factor (ECF subfamily)